MKKAAVIGLFVLILSANFGCVSRSYLPARNNPAYNKAWVNEQRLIREQRNRDWRSRAEADARNGVYSPPAGEGYWYYDDAWRIEKRRDFMEKKRLWERQEGRRAIEDARKGVYQPW